MKDRLPHLIFQHTARTGEYKSPRPPGGSQTKLKPRDRQQHGASLLKELKQIAAHEPDTIAAQQAFGRDAGNGLYLQFESDPGFELAFESLDLKRSGIELLAVVVDEGRMLASVYVPEGKVGEFIRRIESYLDTAKDITSKKGEVKPRNKKLVESIAHIRLAALNGLWTDLPALFPQDDQPFWWEVWLRCGEGIDEVGFFRTHAPKLGMRVADDEVRFLERCVVLVFADRRQMARSIHLLLGIAELRRAKEGAAFFSGMGSVEQHAWVQSAAVQLVPPDADSPAVCILDTGINHQHPLLATFIVDGDRDAVYPQWGKGDHHPQGHGTAMAGLALHGDLTDRLGDAFFESPRHRVESVKVLPPQGGNDPSLYGWVYNEAIQRATTFAAQRPRLFCSAITTTDGRDLGRPSSWSAQLDKIASGMEDGRPQLILQSAGNLERSAKNHYPAANEKGPIHDPGQAWNLLTIGYFTEKWRIDEEGYAGYRPIAEPGGLGPTSCTAQAWPEKGRQKWPNKPDVVFEGGNWAVDPSDNFPSDLDCLQLLSTGHQPLSKPLVTFGETSAATALAARFAARLMQHHPTLWPETLRGLIVHSARWSEAMLKTIPAQPKKSDLRQLLRAVGFGVPDLDEALWSARNALTLIVQDELQPFTEGDKREIRMRDIHYHALPWPADVLRGLPPETPVEMRVTLSYFIQPNPGERGWSGRFNYASHGLRFRVKASGESPAEFEQRINAAARDEEFERTGASDSDHWVIGSDTRELGSLHSDYWRGYADQLADCGYLAVYPVMGWWRTRKALERWRSKARYALIVTLRTPEQSVDIYTPVAVSVGVAVEV